MIGGRLRAEAGRAARRAGLTLAGGLLVAVGLGFLTVSAGIVLAALLGTAGAAAVLGGLYLGTGCLVLALAGRRAAPAREAAPRDMLPAAIDAFFIGLTAGLGSGVAGGRRDGR